MDFPRTEGLSEDQLAYLAPYPVIWKAEDIINYQTVRHPITGRPTLSRVVFRYISHRYTEENPFHPHYVPTVADHYLGEEGYQVDFYQQETIGAVSLSNGELS